MIRDCASFILKLFSYNTQDSHWNYLPMLRGSERWGESRGMLVSALIRMERTVSAADGGLFTNGPSRVSWMDNVCVVNIGGATCIISYQPAV